MRFNWSTPPPAPAASSSQVMGSDHAEPDSSGRQTRDDRPDFAAAQGADGAIAHVSHYTPGRSLAADPRQRRLGCDRRHAPPPGDARRLHSAESEARRSQLPRLHRLPPTGSGVAARRRRWGCAGSHRRGCPGHAVAHDGAPDQTPRFGRQTPPRNISWRRDGPHARGTFRCAQRSPSRPRCPGSTAPIGPRQLTARTAFPPPPAAVTEGSAPGARPYRPGLQLRLIFLACAHPPVTQAGAASNPCFVVSVLPQESSAALATQGRLR